MTSETSVSGSPKGSSYPATATGDNHAGTSLSVGTKVASQVPVPWNETQLIKASLAQKKAATDTIIQHISNMGSRLAMYQTPLSEWKEADRQEFTAAVRSMQTSVYQNMTKYSVDLDSVRVSNLDRYVSEGIVEDSSRSFQFVPNATDEVLESIRLDLVRALQGSREEYHERKQRAVSEWKEIWNGYQSKLRLLNLDVEEAKVELIKRQLDLDQRTEANKKYISFSATEMAQTSASVSSAKIHLERAEELLKLYADIETQEPDLNPDSLNPEK